MSQPYFPFCYFQDKFTKTEDAKVSIMTNALQYGTGFFGGIRGYYNKKGRYLSIFRLEDHYKRFCNSPKILGITIKYKVADLMKITVKLAEMNKPKTDCYFRPFAYAGSTNLSPNLTRDNVFDFAMYQIPLGEYLPVDKGLSVKVSSWNRINDNIIPSRAKICGGYVNSAFARKEAADHGCDEAIFLTTGGHVSEGSAENFFMVRDGVLITPPKSDDILEGITRRSIMQIARDLKIPVEERSIDRSELYVCDEAFFSGTGVQVSWIAKIDGRIISNGKIGSISLKLQKLFFEIVKGNVKKYDQWCTKVTV